jgi:hypothetical protein
MIAEHRKAEDIQSKDPGQFFQPFSDPLFPMRVISSGSAIFPTEKRATHAPVDQMKRLNLIRRTNLRSLHPRHCLFLWLQTNFPLPSPQSHDRKSNCPQHFRLQGGWHRFFPPTGWVAPFFGKNRSDPSRAAFGISSAAVHAARTVRSTLPATL